MAHVTWARRQDYPTIIEVILQREEVLNAFNTDMAAEMIAACSEIRAQRDVRVVAIRSSSTRAFCTGADLKERHQMTEKAWREQHRLFEQMFRAIADFPMATFALIDGYCLAGGMELALNCDLWIVSERAVFGLPEATRGIMPGGGGTRLLSKRIGVHRAKEMIFTGQQYDALAAAQMGLVNRLTSVGELDAAFLKLAVAIVENAPLSVSYCKSAIDELIACPESVAREREIFWYNQAIDTADRYEGIRAFNEKRKPVFEGK